MSIPAWKARAFREEAEEARGGALVEAQSRGVPPDVAHEAAQEAYEEKLAELIDEYERDHAADDDEE